MNSTQSDRRRFLKDAALAGIAVGGITSASGQAPTSESRHADIGAYGERSQFENSVRVTAAFHDPPKDHSSVTPLQDSVGIITPSGLHFWEDHDFGNPLPGGDPRQHRLLIHGLVDRPTTYLWEDLKRLPVGSGVYFIESKSNSKPLKGRDAESVQQVHGKTSCSEWTGAPLSLLLREAGLQKGAKWALAEGSDSGKYTTSIPIEKAMEDVLVAYAQNGESVRPQNGYPLRLIVPGWQGHNDVKWLRRIKVVDEPYMAKWESGSSADQWPDGKARWFRFETGPKSIITRPCPENRLSGHGYCEITGLAWSGGGKILKVEVSTDGGRSWKQARLEGPVLPMAHTRFCFDWNWDGEEAVLQSRCTDERGEIQPSLAELGRHMGVPPDQLEPYFGFPGKLKDHINAIQPWKVNWDGSVRNALFS